MPASALFCFSFSGGGCASCALYVWSRCGWYACMTCTIGPRILRLRTVSYRRRFEVCGEVWAAAWISRRSTGGWRNVRSVSIAHTVYCTDADGGQSEKSEMGRVRGAVGRPHHCSAAHSLTIVPPADQTCTSSTHCHTHTLPPPTSVWSRVLVPHILCATPHCTPHDTDDTVTQLSPRCHRCTVVGASSRTHTDRFQDAILAAPNHSLLHSSHHPLQPPPQHHPLSTTPPQPPHSHSPHSPTRPPLCPCSSVTSRRMRRPIVR